MADSLSMGTEGNFIRGWIVVDLTGPYVRASASAGVVSVRGKTTEKGGPGNNFTELGFVDVFGDGSGREMGKDFSSYYWKAFGVFIDGNSKVLTPVEEMRAFSELKKVPTPRRRIKRRLGWIDEVEKMAGETREVEVVMDDGRKVAGR